MSQVLTEQAVQQISVAVPHHQVGAVTGDDAAFPRAFRIGVGQGLVYPRRQALPASLLNVLYAPLLALA
jgi:hypothetical protein